MVKPSDATPIGLLRRFLGKLKYPQLLILAATLFVLDFFIPDPFLFFDEVLLATITVLLASWRERPREEEEDKPPPRNVTPGAEEGEREEG